MEKIKNDLWHSYCPLCKVDRIRKIDRIEYTSPIDYSTTQIQPLFIPELWQCRKCSSHFVQNAVHETDSIFLYSKGNSVKRWSNNSSFLETKTLVTIQTIEHLFRKDLKLLDVGCNIGELLDFAKTKGCKTYGVEYSEDSLSILDEKGHSTYQSIQLINNLFDIITAFDLIEHLYNLPDFLEICFNHLAPNGYLVCLTGDINCISARITKGNWWYVQYPEHIIFPSKKFFFSHSRFKVVKIIPTYAFNRHEQTIWQVLKGSIKAFLKRTYIGRPSLGPDHFLIILQPRKSS